MKALYIPAAVLLAILVLSLWTGARIDRCTDRWTAEINETIHSFEEERWNEVHAQLLQMHQDWNHRRTAFHLFLEHEDLDETEQLFAGALAASRERDSVELRILLEQLATKLAFLAETQAVSIQNIL